LAVAPSSALRLNKLIKLFISLDMSINVSYKFSHTEKYLQEGQKGEIMVTFGDFG
jgi:hypothetical protein